MTESEKQPVRFDKMPCPVLREHDNVAGFESALKIFCLKITVSVYKKNAGVRQLPVDLILPVFEMVIDTEDLWGLMIQFRKYSEHGEIIQAISTLSNYQKLIEAVK